MEKDKKSLVLYSTEPEPFDSFRKRNPAALDLLEHIGARVKTFDSLDEYADSRPLTTRASMTSLYGSAGGSPNVIKRTSRTPTNNVSPSPFRTSCEAPRQGKSRRSFEEFLES
jgi:hypothetical protein